MRSAASRGGSLLLEVVAGAVVVLAALFGVVRTLFGATGPLNGFLPDWVRSVASRLGSPYFFGESPVVRATLSPDVAVTTSPNLYTYGGGLVPAGRGEFSGPFEAQVNAYVPTTAQSVGLLGSTLLASLTVILVAVLLLRLVRSLRDGDPFVAANARRLRLAGIAVAVGGTGAGLLRSWGEYLVLADSAIRPFVVQRFTVPLVPLAAGVAVLLVAEVFRRGAAMRAELEGLV